MARDEILGKIMKARKNGKGDNFRDGEGLVVITQVIYKKMEEGKTFIARTKVLESRSKGDKDPKTGAPVEPNAVGSKVGWVQKAEKFKSAPGNIKSFVLAVAGMDEVDLESADLTDPKVQTWISEFEQAWDAICNAQMARGHLLKYSTYQQKTKSGPRAGEINTYVSWTHVPPEAGNSDEEIAARRAELDKTDPLESELGD